MSFLADRLEPAAPSASTTARGCAKPMVASAQDVCNLTAGEPNFPLPPHIVEEVDAAMRHDETKFTAIDGTVALTQANRTKLKLSMRRNSDVLTSADRTSPNSRPS
jgi:aspartate aminotransferase